VNVNNKPVITYFSPPRDTSLVSGQGLIFHLDGSDADDEPLYFFWHKNGEAVSDSASYVYQSNSTFTGQDLVTGFITDHHDTLSHSWVVTVTTAVELAEFYAQTDEFNQMVTLHWRTYNEFNNAGFEIWRSSRPMNAYILLTPRVIPGNTKGEYVFTDDTLQAGNTYYYKLVDCNIFGARMEHGPIQTILPLPSDYRLEQNFPNPFTLNLGSPVTVIKFQLPQEERISIQIFNVLGQRVRTLADRRFLPGYQSISWDGCNDNGRLVTSGVYYYEFKAGDFKAIKRLVLMR